MPSHTGSERRKRKTASRRASERSGARPVKKTEKRKKR